MTGQKLTDMNFTKEIIPSYYSVKEVVLPFVRFRGVDILLGPEMKSTGEVMGIDADFGLAFAKAQIAASSSLPVKGTVFISVKDRDKSAVVPIAKALGDLKFNIVATQGTADFLNKNGITTKALKKIKEGSPNATDLLHDSELDLVINTPSGEKPRQDEIVIRSLAVSKGVPCVTTIEGAVASVLGIRAMKEKPMKVTSLQKYHQSTPRGVVHCV
jgi:carbamoyl-phosphate synthase large subunit